MKIERWQMIIVLLVPLSFSLVGAVGAYYFTTHQAWHDTGVITSIGSSYQWDSVRSNYETIWSVTVATSQNGNITITSTNSCPFGESCMNASIPEFRVGETLGIVKFYTNYGGAWYQAQVLP